MALIEALLFHGKEDIRVEFIPSQKCESDEVRVKIAYCDVCGLDIHEFLGGPIFPPLAGEKNLYTGVKLPITMGREMSGAIAEIGSRIGGLKVGQKVTINPSMDDRHHGMETCMACKSGRPNVCKHWACYGLSAEGGGLAEEIVVKRFSFIALPDGVSLKIGALAEPLAVVKPGGIVFNVAIHEKALQLNPNSFTFKEVKMMGGLCYTNEDFEDVLGELASGKLPVAEDMITSIAPLRKAVEGAFLELISNKAKNVKILIQLSQSTDLA
ncbi:chaperonin 10-like protein [Rhexocercosporidium sp. MPI-PUGE-AT-0058]|nr:chaperonin 10-like protein [Rhexocercosporidium sp. MPI-PUGE-AT-0058]